MFSRDKFILSELVLSLSVLIAFFSYLSLNKLSNRVFLCSLLVSFVAFNQIQFVQKESPLGLATESAHPGKAFLSFFFFVEGIHKSLFEF